MAQVGTRVRACKLIGQGILDVLRAGGNLLPHRVDAAHHQLIADRHFLLDSCQLHGVAAHSVEPAHRRQFLLEALALFKLRGDHVVGRD